MPQYYPLLQWLVNWRVKIRYVIIRSGPDELATCFANKLYNGLTICNPFFRGKATLAIHESEWYAGGLYFRGSTISGPLSDEYDDSWIKQCEPAGEVLGNACLD